MPAAKLDQIRQARHGAVIIHDLADHARWFQSGETCQIDGCFGLSATLKDTAGARTKRKYVARSRKIFRLTVWIDRRLDCLCAIIGRDSGCYIVADYIN